MTKRVFNSFGSSSSHTFSKCNSDIEKVPQSSVKSNLTSKMDKPKQPVQNISKGTTIMINLPKGNHWILRIGVVASCQKLGIILENKVILKLMLSKNVNNKKCALKFLCFNEEKIIKIRIQLWIYIKICPLNFNTTQCARRARKGSIPVGAVGAAGAAPVLDISRLYILLSLLYPSR